MNPVTCVLIDDEPLARENLKDLLEAHPEVVVIGEAGTVAEARRVLSDKRPNAAFLDIQMPGGTGFDVLAGLEFPLQVIFVTAYDEYAVRAFQVNAVDYLLKPIDRELLAGAVGRLVSGISGDLGDRPHEGPQAVPFRLSDQVLVVEKGRHFFVPLRSVSAIRAFRNYTEILCEQSRTYLFRRNMNFWYARLPSPPFVQLDRSVIINRDQVIGWNTRGRSLQVAFQRGAASLDLGRSASERFKKMFAEKRPSA